MIPYPYYKREYIWYGVCVRYLIIYVKKDFRLLMLLPTIYIHTVTTMIIKYISTFYRIPNFHLKCKTQGKNCLRFYTIDTSKGRTWILRIEFQFSKHRTYNVYWMISFVNCIYVYFWGFVWKKKRKLYGFVLTRSSMENWRVNLWHCHFQRKNRKSRM